MRFLNLLAPVLALASCVAAQAQSPTYDLGRTPSEKEILAWDIAVGPEGKELPVGSGTAKEGEALYARKCAACHGPTATEGKAPRLVGRQMRTVGSYWPFATSIWDYISRAMPIYQEGSLSVDEVYSLTAFLLFKNGIIQESDAMDAESLPKVQMPNRNGYQPPPVSEWKPGMHRRFEILP